MTAPLTPLDLATAALGTSGVEHAQLRSHYASTSLTAAFTDDAVAEVLARVAWQQRIEAGLIADVPWDVDLDTFTTEARKQHRTLQRTLMHIARPHVAALRAHFLRGTE